MADPFIAYRRMMQEDLQVNKGPDPVDLHVGARLKLRRNLIGMSQEHMGKALGLTFQQIQKYERASCRISASRLHQMSKLLNVPIEWFFGDLPAALTPRVGFSDSNQTPLEGSPAAGSEVLHKRETLDLIRAYYNITDPKKRRKVLDLVKTMGEE